MSDQLQLLNDLAVRPSAVEWFRGLFNRAHLEVKDTNEEFAVVHHGDHMTIERGFEGGRGDFVVPLEAQNVQNLVNFFQDDHVEPYEEYRIVKFMLQPCLVAGLALPILRNPIIQCILKLDSHWQEAILDPEGNEDEKLTVIYVNGQWLIIPGYWGHPQRRLVMTPAQVLEYQRRVFAAAEDGRLTAWRDVAKWYVDWREEVSVAV